MSFMDAANYDSIIQKVNEANEDAEDDPNDALPLIAEVAEEERGTIKFSNNRQGNEEMEF